MTSRNINKSICRQHLKKEQEERRKRDQVTKEMKKPLTEPERGFFKFLSNVIKKGGTIK